MTDLYLRADTEAEMIAALPWAHDGDQWITATHQFALAPIGPLCIQPGTYDEDGEEITPPVMDTRYHLNLRCSEEIAGRVPGDILVWPAPKTPLQGWL